MKLNNKGFAISSIMYIILIVAIILITLTLAIMSSRKLLIDKVKDEVINDIYGDLPDIYQKVEYIESTGTQYIDTLINPANKKIGAILDFQFNSVVNSKAGVFGSYKTDGTDNIQFTVYTSKWRIKINSVAIYGDNYDTQRHIVRLNMPGGTKIDDVIINATQYTIDKTNTSNLYLCACNYDVSNETTNYSLKGKLYSAKIYDDKTLIRDYVPCYKIADGEIGLYDLVEDKFYVNSGTGIFKKGKDI